MSDCPFYNYKSNTRGKILLENECCIYIQFIDSVPEGSGMIVPKEHRETVFELTEVEWEATYSLLQKVKRVVDEQLKPDGYNVGWDVGKIGGQEVFHAHLHVIPRYANELYAGKGIRYWIKQPQNNRNNDHENIKFR